MPNDSDPQSFWELSLSDKIARVFNRTALGAGVLLGGWHVFEQNWLSAAVIFFVLVPLYFYLHNRVNAP